MSNDEIKKYIEKYNEQYRTIKEQIFNYSEHIQLLESYKNNESVKRKIEDFKNKISKLKIEKTNIIKKIMYYENLYKRMNTKMVADNNEIELRMSNNNYYDIWSKRDNKKIGFISYNKYLNYELGNICYEIDEDYRGNNYAYKALVLLSSYLKENGIYNLSLSIRENNIPSIKTAEKFKDNVLDFTVQNKKGLYKNISLYYYKIGEDE